MYIHVYVYIRDFSFNTGSIYNIIAIKSLSTQTNVRRKL